MTWRSWQKSKALSVRMMQPQLSVCGKEIDALVKQILAEHFPENTAAPTIYFGRTPSLAHIENPRGELGAIIWMHYALNDPATPAYVFSSVLTHELLHTRVPPREIDGKWVSHPPEFWEEENRISLPGRIRSWEWLYENFGAALKRDSEHECIWVNNKRMKQLLRGRNLTDRDLLHLGPAPNFAHNRLAFGFREQALRAFDPKTR